jgi:2'-5' RNA ligase
MHERTPAGTLLHEKHNLFFALTPDDETRSAIASAVDGLRATVVTSGRWLKPPRYHLTLAFLGEFGEVPADLIASALAAAGKVRVPTIEISLDRVGSFSARRIPVWLGCDTPPALRELHELLAHALREQGCDPRRDANFVPHVTILRDADAAFDQSLAPAIRWRVDAFVFIDSRTQPPAPYRELGRWPLG